MTVLFKCCPRCAGDVDIRGDLYGDYRECLQCGYIRDIEPNSRQNHFWVSRAKGRQKKQAQANGNSPAQYDSEMLRQAYEVITEVMKGAETPMTIDNITGETGYNNGLIAAVMRNHINDFYLEKGDTPRYGLKWEG